MDVAIVGAGVVGLACAVAAARRGLRVVVLERHEGPGRETSSRNSGVIHAGLYYPPGSLKARLCVEGRQRLYHWCRQYGVPHLKTGKLVLATRDDELATLESLHARARANGAGDLRWLPGAHIQRQDPALRAVAGLWSPESGLVDAHGVLDTLVAQARALDVDVAWRTRLLGMEPGDPVRLHTEGPHGEPFTLEAGRAVNAAGLAADRIAAMAGVDVDRRGWRQHPCKGQYFALVGGAPRPRTALVYPVPDPAGLGIHLTRDLGGRHIAGPDAQYVDTVEYSVDEGRATAFAEAVARYLPGLTPQHLAPDYAGMRPKLQGPGEGFRDFVLAEAPPRVTHLLGIESPGLTAALALAEEVATRAAETR